MKRFRAEKFAKIAAMLEGISASTEALTNVGAEVAAKSGFSVNMPRMIGSGPLGEPTRTNAEELFREYEKECLTLGLITSAITCRRILGLLTRPDCTFGEFTPLLVELASRITDELSGMFFLSLDTSNADRYDNPTKGWGDTINRFPSALIDIEESSKCLALDRHTAAVFHLMRVMEVGLRALGAALNDPSMDPRTNPTWERILGRCDAELQKPRNQRSPTWAADDIFFSDAVANLRAVKDAWRNPTLHIGVSYDEEKALEVWNAVRAFMRHLATKLHE